MRSKSLMMFAIILLLAPMVLGLTATIDKPKMVLYKNISAGETITFEESVVAVNENNYSVNIQVEAKGDLIGLVTIKEPNFVLGENETREIFYEVVISEPGVYTGDVIVVFGEPNTSSVVSLAQILTVSVVSNENENSSNLNYLFTLIIFLLLILVILIWKMKSKKINLLKFGRKNE